MIKKTFSAAKNTTAFLLAVVNAFNPLAYRGALQKSLRAITLHLLGSLLLVTLVMAAVTLPSMAGFGSRSQFPFDKFSNLTLRAEISTKEPIESQLFWLGNAKVFVNTTADGAATGKYDFVLTSTELRTRPLPCLFRQELCSLLKVKQDAVPVSELDIAREAQSNTAVIPTFILLLLPGLTIFLFLTMVLKYFLVSLAVAALGFILLKITRRDTGFIELSKIAFYAANALAIIDAAASILRHTGAAIPSFVPLAAYGLIIMTAVALNEQRSSDSMI